jgi:cation:H+ antiporter
MGIALDFIILAVSFFFLFKAANIFVDSASNIAELLKIPKIIIGIILVSLATTSPEFTVSIMAAYRGQPEIALGNALGSVICDDGLALALAAILAPGFILIDRKVLKTAGIFLMSVAVLTFLMASDGHIGRIEGVVLLLLLAAYFIFLYFSEKKRRRESRLAGPSARGAAAGPGTQKQQTSRGRIAAFFILGLAGIIIASHFIVESAVSIALFFGISEAVIGLTIVAFGTSLPEISTCISAARKGEGQIAAGNIIGADILNILWIVGMSSIVNPIRVSDRFIFFTFPWMLVIVGTMLLSMRIRYRLSKTKGLILLTLYAVFMLMSVYLFYVKA